MKLLAILLLSLQSQASVDLHAHLFMKQGVWWAFHGEFNDEIKANSYDDKMSSQVNPVEISKSGLRVLVAALFAHPAFVYNEKESIRRQIAIARQFVTDHPEWIIASNGKDALKAFDEGKNILILSLEGAVGVLEDEKDLREFVDEGQISIVTLLHLSGDKFGDVAFLRGIQAMTAPFALFGSWITGHRTDGILTNRGGLHPRGHDFIKELAKRGVWIDLPHASDKSQKPIMDLYQRQGWPLIHTHTSLRKHYGAERGVSEAQLRAVAESGGVVGLMPSEAQLKGTPVPKELCPDPCKDCQGSVAALAHHFNQTAAIVGAINTHIGSDFNGAVNHMKPACGTETDLDKGDFYRMSQMPALFKALKNLGVDFGGSPNERARAFLKTWARISQNIKPGLTYSVDGK